MYHIPETVNNAKHQKLCMQIHSSISQVPMPYFSQHVPLLTHTSNTFRALDKCSVCVCCSKFFQKLEKMVRVDGKVDTVFPSEGKSETFSYCLAILVDDDVEFGTFDAIISACEVYVDNIV